MHAIRKKTRQLRNLEPVKDFASSLNFEGRGRDLNPGGGLHRPVGYQATSPRPLIESFQLLSHIPVRVYLRFPKPRAKKLGGLKWTEDAEGL